MRIDMQKLFGLLLVFAVVSFAAAQDGVINPQTDASKLTTGTLAAARGGAGTITGALKGSGAGVVSQAACADLSDCIPGSWTPALAGTTSGGWTTSVGVGSYERVGRQVSVRFTLLTSAASSPVGNIQITGLPLTATATGNDNGSCFFSLQTGLTNSASFTTFTGLITASTAVIVIYENGSGQAFQAATVAKAGSTPGLVGYCNYHL